MSKKNKKIKQTYSLEEVKERVFSKEERIKYEQELPKEFAKLRRKYFAELGKDLKKARQAKLLTQEVLAKKIGTTKSNISRLESGNQNVTIGYLTKVADALGKTVSIVID